MEIWNHTEFVYPFVPQEVIDRAPSARASLPNRYCDPRIVRQLYDEVFDEYRLCDELGLNICTNEHHAGVNNLSGANPVITGAVARTTTKAKILSLGTLVTVRPDPVRVAEEYATIDVLSGGRLQIGFVKSGATEMASGDMQPLFRNERQWEALDLIEKALTHHDGPFSWEGEHFTHAHVNIWPRPLQQPRPDFWMATSEPGNVAELGRRGFVMVSVFTGDRPREAGDRRLPQGVEGDACRAAAGAPARLQRFLRRGRHRRGSAAARRKMQLVPFRRRQGRAAIQQVPAGLPFRGPAARRLAQSRPADGPFAGQPDRQGPHLRRQSRHRGAAGQGVQASGRRPRPSRHPDQAGARDARGGGEERTRSQPREVLPQLQDLEPLELAA